MRTSFTAEMSFSIRFVNKFFGQSIQQKLAFSTTKLQLEVATTVPGVKSPQKYVYKKTEQVLPEFRPMYLDLQATTPLDPRVLDAMLPFMIDMYGNPHSRSHAFGWESEQAVERARKQV